MDNTQSDRCGYQWPEDHKIGDRADQQNCCYRETHSGSNRCVWHTDPEDIEKRVEELDSSRVSIDVRKENTTSVELLDGACLSGVDLRGCISFHKTAIRDATLSGASLWNTDLSGALLQGIDLTGAHLVDADLSETNLFNADLSESVLFDANLSFADLQGADISDARLRDADLSFANIYSANLSGAHLGEANLHRTILQDGNLSDAHLTDADLSRARLERANLSNAQLEKAELSAADLSSANLTEANFTNAHLTNSNLERALLSRATLFGSDLRGARLNGAVLGDIRVDSETKFLGKPSHEDNLSPYAVSAIRSTPTCVYDPNYGENGHENIDKAKSVYRALEELARRTARTRLQATCFVRRQDLQKNKYKQDAMNPNVPFEERLIASARYSRAKVARMTLLYGESPWRIIAGSIGFVLFIALLYPMGEWLRPTGGDPITYSRIFQDPELLFELLYFSTLTFTTLGMGDYEPLGFGQVLATLNTAFGAVLIALLVFVLGRRAAR